MMFLDRAPEKLETRVFTAMPDKFRRKGQPSAWANANNGGEPMDCFLEGPAFDAEGFLYFVDILFGRIFTESQTGAVLVADTPYPGVALPRRPRSHS